MQGGAPFGRQGTACFASNQGKTNQQIALELDTRTARASRWRQRFAADRLAGLADAAWPRPLRQDHG